MQNHLRTELIVNALDMAVGQRKPKDVTHHSDQGCQQTSLAFGNRCKEAGVRPLMGSVGDAYDNAMAESSLSTLECELDPGMRNAEPAFLQLAGRGSHGLLRLRRSFLQSPAPALEHRLSISSRLRKEL